MKTPSAFFAGAILFFFACAAPAAPQAPAGGIRIHCASPYTHVWAWHGETNLFRVWPGAAMEEEGGFWRTCRFDGRTALSVVFSEDGRNQTRDLAVPGAGEWWFFRGGWHRENPFARPRFAGRGGRAARERTWYQLLVYAFADGDGDGVGDFKGLVEHLDYLEALGIGGILLSPIHPADSYHGYDVTDYRAVNPAFEVGGVDFAALLRACRARGIKVLLDMVFNHTSANHPWRREHADWYNGEGVFGGWMPDLDYDKAGVRREIKDIGRFWLAKGVDGFRCDAATWIYGGGGSWQVETGVFARSVDWWREFAAAMREKREDAYLVGEVWTELPWIERFFASGMGAFNFSAPFWVKDALEGENAAYWVDETVRHQARVRGGDADGIEAAFLSNHDLNRFAAFDKGEAELKFANALNVLAPGGSFVYYGDELGMTGSGGKWHDMTLRTSMPFAAGRTDTARFMDGAATNPGPSAEAEAGDPRSVFAYTAKAIRLKNAHPTLYTGTAEKLETGSASCAALRVEDDRACCVLLVNASRTPATVSVKGAYRIAGDLSTEGAVSVRGGDLVLPGLSLVLLEGDVSVRVRNP